MATLTGDNGLLQNATTAKKENEEAKELELIKLAVSAAKLDGQGSITKDNLESELKSNFGYNKEVFENNTFFYCNGYRIYKDGRVDEGKLLPDEYQQVEYIQSSGTQYIDTNLKASEHPNIIVEIEGSLININYQCVFGVGFHKDWNQNNSWISIGCGKNSNFIAQNGIAGKEENIETADKNKHTFILDTVSSIGKVDHNLKLLNSENRKDINYNYVIFALNFDGSILDKASFKMSSCKITENEKNILNLIPCYSTTIVTDVNGIEKPKDTIGLYDTVNNKFYVNKGTGIFIKGPEV